MKKLKQIILFCSVVGISPCLAQTATDSIAIVSAHWETKEISAGLTSKCCSFEHLYQGAQYVSIVEVRGNRKHPAHIGTSTKMMRLSELAREKHAVAAINGSYYNMSKGTPVCYLKEGDSVVGSTTEQEFSIRVTGAIRTTRKGKVKLLPWSEETEKHYKKKRGSIMASGPLMLHKGHYSDWSNCDEDFIKTKHPRSAIAITSDRRVLLITVDGRSQGNAVGVSIPELAHLVKVLGGKDALNLDGGGSTMLYLDGEILNHPCDNQQFDHHGERSIPNFIYFLSK